MSLFQSIVIEKYVRELDQTELNSAWQAYSDYFLDLGIQDNIRISKEEQYQEGFLRDLFVKVLGYTLNPNPDYDLTTEFKNQTGSKKADGAILKDGHAIGVIELKGMNTTDLSKIEPQAFGYKNNQPKCRYVITSNFQKLRLYIDNAVEFIEFNLFTLSQADFAQLYLLLNRDSILSDLPVTIKSASLSQEEAITKQLYKDYSVFKRELFDDLTTHNPSIDNLVLFQKSQKLLDRLLFIFFAEDSHLLPANFAKGIISEWEQLKSLKMTVPLYDRIKAYFGYLDKGHKDEHSEIFAYNGGLFSPDALLDSVIISDDILQTHIKILSEYDFDSEVDVNILGHIFENSLTELDEVKAQLAGEAVDKSQTKRKKDGVFYTPKYITKYIVENTVGKLCADKKAELAINDEDYQQDVTINKDGTKKKKSAKQLAIETQALERLHAYRDWLLQITICDPACGSGAFLNEALNFLIAEHEYIVELETKLFGSGLPYADIENSILENNLFGVDINEESVEIAKLSLWLRTAQPRRKLNNLNDNIQCGNSLIDDADVAGDKAFNWQTAFPQVFAKGGFDVVIGNPPYGAEISKEQQAYYLKSYTTPAYKLDTYAIFIEASMSIVKKQGSVGLIVPYTWLTISQHSKLRKFLFEFEISEIVNLPNKVFSDADLDTVILFVNDKQPNTKIKLSYSNGNIILSDEKFINIENVKKNNDLLINLYLLEEDLDIVEKIENKSTLDSYFDVSQGYIPYRRSDLVKKYGKEEGNKIVDERLWHSDIKISESWRQEIQGKDISRYKNSESFQYIKYGKHLAGYVEERFFTEHRISIMEVTRGDIYRLKATLLKKEYFNTPSLINIIKKQEHAGSLNTLLAIINSRLMSWYHTKAHSKANAETSIPKILVKDLRSLPIIPEDKNLAQKADLMLSLNEQLQDLT
ncbi:N-6 DNA methylase, partial [uncultured Psychrobacter sp.]|uniref:Eco57I restriction-modification methylase domain-containing protein n=1 Tax=uncultured Psychrobacter sp. TaxID=259303 RepID=UPI0030DC4FCE